MCVCACLHVCASLHVCYVFMCVSTHLHVILCIRIFLNVSVSEPICVFVCMFLLCVWGCVYVYIHVFVLACVLSYLQIYFLTSDTPYSLSGGYLLLLPQPQHLFHLLLQAL